ncbi:MAG: DNA polymerase III subunit beta [Candidatus Pacebacteria bacterium]|nr:DNA polymerase III subunit beta [Candidatus Paceibacterota bacterium]
MKFKILQENLKQSLQILQNAIPKNPRLPILSSVYFEIKEGVLTLAATDLYLGIRTKNRVQTDKEVKLVLPGEIFKKIIYSLDPGELTVEQKDKEVIISSGKSRVKIPMQPASEYPDFPEIEGQQFSFSAELMQKTKDLVSFAASSDQARPVLTAVMHKFSPEGMEIASTDSYRLSLIKNQEIDSEESFKLLIPAKAMAQVFRILGQTEEDSVGLQVSAELKQAKFIVDNSEIFVRLIDGDYPPYEKIIPEEFATKIEVDGESFEQEVKRAYVLTQETSNIVKLSLVEGELEVSSHSPTQGEYKGSLVVEVEGEGSGQVAFNATYLLDMLSSVKPKKITLQMNDSLKPVMLTTESQPDFKYIVMPFKMND